MRFIPKPSYYWLTTSAPNLTVKAWDTTEGSSILRQTELSWMNINTRPYFNTTRSLSNSIGLFSSTTCTLVASRYGCNDVPNSALIHDACCVCGGDGATCDGCDGVQRSNAKYDSCDICEGTGVTCRGCDYIPWSSTVSGSCKECISSSSSNGSLIYPSDSFKDCYGVCYGAAVVDECAVCSDGTTLHNYNSDK